MPDIVTVLKSANLGEEESMRVVKKRRGYDTNSSKIETRVEGAERGGGKNS